MLAVAFPPRTRAVIGVLAVVTGVGAVGPVVVRTGWASSGRDGLAARLIRLDPGARLGANTQVATVVGARLAGVRGRVNFIIGLAPRQRIVGGAGHDQLGARGAGGARILGGTATTSSMVATATTFSTAATATTASTAATAMTASRAATATT
jgi:hypothetical protein